MKRRGEGVGKISFFLCRLKRYDLSNHHSTLHFQWFDIRSMTALWLPSNVVNVNYRSLYM